MYTHIYRGILCNGEKTIKLWEGTAKKRTSSKDILLLKPNPSIPPSNNPHPKAVSLTVEFQTTKGPMVYPSTSELSVSTFFRSVESVSYSRVFAAIVLVCFSSSTNTAHTHAEMNRR